MLSHTTKALIHVSENFLYPEYKYFHMNKKWADSLHRYFINKNILIANNKIPNFSHQKNINQLCIH